MGRLGELDLAERLAPTVPRWVTAMSVGLLATAVAAIIRFALDTLVPGAAVFPLVFPATMIATLFAGWIAGTTAGTVSILFAWYYLYPIKTSFRFETAAQAVSFVTVVIACIITVSLAEMFRRIARRATQERDRELAERQLFLDEFDHRVKNNFMLVASLLDMQRRRAGTSETADALGQALSRVESIARAHRHLYRGNADPGLVDMATYVEELCSALSEALFLRGAVTLSCRSVHGALPRDRAVSIGLILNELVTNAVKHAFEGRDGGRIDVRFEAAEPGWRLVVSDDGRGMAPDAQSTSRDGGLGQRLVGAFVRQARGTISTESDQTGTVATVELEP